MNKGRFVRTFLITAVLMVFFAIPTASFAATTPTVTSQTTEVIAAPLTAATEQGVIDTYANLSGAYMRSQIALARLSTKGIDMTNANATLVKTALSLTSVKKDITNKTITEKTLVELNDARTLLLQSLTEAKNAINTK